MRLFQNKMSQWSLSLLLFLPVFSVSAVPFTVDADLNDWINSPQGQATDWNPYKPNVFYQEEDQAGGHLNPGGGGQPYDAEAIYVAVASNQLLVAVVTGRQPEVTDWPAGDIAIDFGNDGTFEYGIVAYGDGGKSYAGSYLNGYKGGIGDAGDFYRVNEWNYGIWKGDGKTDYQTDPALMSVYKKAHPTTVKSGVKLDEVMLEYKKATFDGDDIAKLGQWGGEHYVIEAAIPLDLFDPALLGQKFTVHWTMACANDWIETDPATVPEPPVAFLIAAGLMGMWRAKSGNDNSKA